MRKQMTGDNVRRLIFTTIFAIFLTSFINLNAQWARTYDPYSFSEAKSIQQTNDGGYIIAGFAWGGSLSVWKDFLVMKLSSSGEIEWEKSFGGSEHDIAYSVQQTSDGGYVVAGETSSFGAGDADAWVVKLSSTGNIEWQKAYGGSSFDTSHSILQTADGGYVFAGMSSSFDFVDLWIVKLSSTGDIEWQKIYGDSFDQAYSIQQTDDGGYIVAGESTSEGLILKLSSDGDQEWLKIYSGTSWVNFYSIQQTNDGGYIVAGDSTSFVAGNDALVLKLSSDGDIEWQRIYGGTEYDYAYAVQQTSDCGYIVAGKTSADAWVFKLSPTGEVEWQKTYGEYSVANSIQQIGSEGYIVAGEDSSDILVLKLHADGSIDPTCDFIVDTDVFVVNANTSPSGVAVFPQDTSASCSNTLVSVQEPGSTSDLECGSAKYALTISTTTGGSTNPSPGGYSYDYGAAVIIDASSETGYQFSHWSGSVLPGDENDNPLTINMDTDKSVKANFIPVTGNFELIINTASGGTTNPPAGAYSYAGGTAVYINALPDSGSSFSHWTGDVPSGHENENPLSLTMNSNKSITPHFNIAKTWTFMVYLDGDNNLEYDAIFDFLEMAMVGSGDYINIVVQFDRNSGYDIGYGDWTSTKRFYITNGMQPTSDNALEDLGELNHGDPQTLIDFISWAKSAYPADRYALILWNHGGGWRDSADKKESLQVSSRKKEKSDFRAVCWDETDGDDCLYMDEVQSALNATGVVDLIGFDACLMGMIEVAYEIRDRGDIMVGSEETVPANGWPYHLILRDLAADPFRYPSDFATAIVDRYYESYQNSYFTHAALDLSNMEDLADALSSLALAMIDSWNSDRGYIADAAEAVQAEVEDTVIHERHGSSWPEAHGLAIYFPKALIDFSADYNENTIDFLEETQWEEFLSVYYNSMRGSWIAARRAGSQQFGVTQHIDLYHFCDLVKSGAAALDFYAPSQIPHEYAGGGTAQNFHQDDSNLYHSLPFAFPYFGQVISAGSVFTICSNGFISFGSSSTDYYNSGSELVNKKRIAPLWTDLRTDCSAQPDEDIYITENADNLIIRWVAETYGYGDPVNFELILYEDGRIQFNYDGGNVDLQRPWDVPTIAISKGDGVNYYAAICNGERTFTDAESVIFTPQEVQSFNLTISSSAYGTTQPPPGTHGFPVGLDIEIEAIPNPGCRFDGWTGDVPSGHENDNPLTVTMDSNKSIGAHFVRQCTLNLYAGTGGTTDPPPGDYTHDSGTAVVITAVPDSGYAFSRWTGDVFSYQEDDNPLTLTLYSDKSVTANFIPQHTLTIAAGSGGTTDPSPGSYDYAPGTQVAVTAIPNTGYQFNGWSGDASGTTNPITVTMDDDKMIAANFAAIDSGGGGTGDDSGDSRGGGGGCFIATAAYGSPAHPYIGVLRAFRDRYLMTNKLGRGFVELYYKYSPVFAEMIARNKVLKVAAQVNLMPLIILSLSMVHLGPAGTVSILLIISITPVFLVPLRAAKRRLKEKAS